MMTPRGRAEIKVWDEDGTLVATHLVEDIQSLSYEINREGIDPLDWLAEGRPIPTIGSVVFRFEFPRVLTTYLYPKETP